MTTVAFIGLGIMGAPMAGHLVDAGFDVVGVNRSPGAVARLVERGGRGAESAADAAREADIVALMVPDSPDVHEVLAGDGGVFAAAREGTLIIDFSSIRPDVAVELAAQARQRTLRMLDAPVSGGEAGAVAGTLSIMVGGDASDFDTARPVFEAVGATVVHVGPSGSGQTVKAANQLIVAGNIQLLAEAVAFLEAYGVDTTAALKVLGGGLAGSKVLDQKGEGMLARSFQPGFRVDLHHKDLGIVTTAAREAGVVIPLGAVVAQLMASLRANGDGGLDHSALLRGVFRLSGRDPDRLDIDRRTDEQEIVHAPHAPVDAAVAMLEGEGVNIAFGVPGAAIPLPLCVTRSAASATSACATSRAPRTRPRASGAARRQPRGLRRHVRTRRHGHDHRALLRVGGLGPDALHHRPGAGALLHNEDFQAVDIVAIAAPCASGDQVQEPAQVPWAFQQAFHRTRAGRPGPVLLDLPLDVQQADIEWDPETYDPRLALHAAGRPALRRPRRSTCWSAPSGRSSSPAA